MLADDLLPETVVSVITEHFSKKNEKLPGILIRRIKADLYSAPYIISATVVAGIIDLIVFWLLFSDRATGLASYDIENPSKQLLHLVADLVARGEATVETMRVDRLKGKVLSPYDVVKDGRVRDVIAVVAGTINQAIGGDSGVR